MPRQDRVKDLRASIGLLPDRSELEDDMNEIVYKYGGNYAEEQRWKKLYEVEKRAIFNKHSPVMYSDSQTDRNNYLIKASLELENYCHDLYHSNLDDRQEIREGFGKLLDAKMRNRYNSHERNCVWVVEETKDESEGVPVKRRRNDSEAENENGSADPGNRGPRAKVRRTAVVQRAASVKSSEEEGEKDKDNQQANESNA